MFLAILVVIISLSLLMALHEFGHFILAKKFGVGVEEFGIGMPPRLIGKKIGETFYSLNLIPFGAFVKIHGEEGSKDVLDFRSFFTKPAWQRALILSGGVISFWFISIILFTIVLGCGALTAVGDADNPNFLNPKVQILGIVSNSPAESVDLKVGDTILKLISEKDVLEANKVEEVRSFIKKHGEVPIFLTIQRGKKVFETNITPKITPSAKEAHLGVYLQRTAVVKHSWSSAPIEGIKTTFNTTKLALLGYFEILKNIFRGKGLPEGVEIMGPVGIGSFMVGAFEISFVYFLQILATISVFLAIFNLLPIPALDGGKLLFLGIEKIKGKPINEKIERNINSFFFFLLIGLMIFVTVRDIVKLF